MKLRINTDPPLRLEAFVIQMKLNIITILLTQHN